MAGTKADKTPDAADEADDRPELIEVDPLAPEIHGSEASYARFLREARAIEDAAVRPMRADPMLAHANVVRGCAALLPYEAHLAEHLPEVDLEEIRSLPELALAVVWAAFLVERESGETRVCLAEASALRRLLLRSTQALAEAGVLGAADAAKAKDARGSIDVGAEAAALGAMLGKKAELLEGQSPVTPALASRAVELGAELRARLSGKGASRKGSSGGPSPVEARDRLWSLLAQRHERMWAIGAYVFGFSVDDYVPALLARPEAKGRKKGR